MDKLKIVVDHLSDGLMEIDANGIIVYCNKKAAALDDIAIQDVLGKPLLSVYPSLKRNTSTLYKVLQTGEPILNVEQSFVTYKGKTIATINSTVPIKENGRIRGAIEISRDITEVKDMSERIADLQRRVYSSVKEAEVTENSMLSFHFDDIITQNEQLIQLKDKAFKASKLSSPVLVAGDTGTGKELFVQSIHHASARSNAPFIAQNCAALPANLLEGILFGTVEGAYTGARDRAGLLETANGGTIFLDEINSMPLELQAKLLRFLQDGWLRRVGDNHSRKVDVRVIAAINTSPELVLENGDLRTDLFYRLNTITLELPTLKERLEDLPLLVAHFTTYFNKKLKRQVRGITEDVMALFKIYDWPGNVRELEHVIEGAISMLDGMWITLAELPPQLLKKLGPVQKEFDPNVNLADAVNELEKKMIQQAMLTTAGNVSEAAKQLGIPRQTLQYKLKRLTLY
ncbi:MULTISPECIES: sigma-54-dependent Fis family transcriptional regulator [unclassified Fusibacter]|uniref:sigma-54 interaction domain-containing protein n=1 Tax=unclassified Fusibacter TaxID=2624464 RepID=UPI0013E953D4|nr:MULTISPECIES: sigma 54-interacting transcriptional regulator [unclassified Fusibacter]MCK8059303.1 sigma 54-interacting transcriptional regulator [Fusibacter sp. A2]NPE21233.1 sigma 54-interacting transcriptional regulator [Fusibacter sp. A1]